MSATIIEYLSEYGVGIQKIDNIEAPSSESVQIFESKNDWVVVIWPAYFNSNDFPTAKFLSKKLKTTVSSSSIYDGESWSHGLFKSGDELNRYSSSFRFPIDFSNGIKFISWSTNLKVLSIEFNVNKNSISCFFRSKPPIKTGNNCGVTAEYHGSPWVFIDFWESVGIIYPDLENIKAKYSYALDNDFDQKLPIQ